MNLLQEDAMVKLIAASAVLISGLAFATYAQEQDKGQMPQQQMPEHMGGMMQQMFLRGSSR